jgi:hypothetical protein
MAADVSYPAPPFETRFRFVAPPSPARQPFVRRFALNQQQLTYALNVEAQVMARATIQSQGVPWDTFKWVVTGLVTIIGAGVGYLLTDLKGEVHDFRKEISDTQKGIAKELADTRVQIGKEIADTRIQVSREISETRVEITREIGALQTQAAATNTKLDDLISAEARRRR